MADFVHIGSHIVSKENISHINQDISVVQKMRINIWFNNGGCIQVKFDTLADLAYAFNDLIKDLT